jgi:hypothetical protein
MARLTRKEERLLRRTADVVRMYVACLTFVAPLLCVAAAARKYAVVDRALGSPEIPPMATWGNITGIYLPLFAAVGAYVWATRAAPDRNLAPNGYAMALFRDVFTVVVLTVVLLVPWVLYRWGASIQSVNAYVVWYQTVLTAVAGGAFAYYFHGRISADRPAAADAPAAAPARKAPRRPRADQPAAEVAAEG